MKEYSRVLVRGSIGLLLVAGGYLAAMRTEVPPYQALGGVVWVKNGIHYLNDEQIKERISEINSPYETRMAEYVQKNTPTCENSKEGFCKVDTGVYSIKTLVASAVEYKPATPDRKEVIGYCTLCRDGTFSPSCAVGRGACSWHGGVAAYNVEKYRVIPGTPAVEAKPAVYSYESKSYKVSPLYTSPSTPGLKAIASFELSD